MPSSIQIPDRQHDGPLSLAVFSPYGRRRMEAAKIFSQCGDVHTREFADYPPSLDVVPYLVEMRFDAIVIDLDGNPEFALEVVEALCLAGPSIVMVFSEQTDPRLILRSMRAGAREFLTVPFNPDTITKALHWVGNHRQPTAATIKPDARLLLFFGAKGGVGVTTIATNFALALSQESRQSTLLIDLNLQLGDAAVNLGIDAPYSILDALRNSSHLDAAFLSRLVARHPSGLSVLAAPADLSATTATNADIGALFSVARQQFHYVVVDAGKKIDVRQFHRFDEASSAYLITEIGIPELRNANRLIAQFSVDHCPKLEIVVNRYHSRYLGITDEHLAKALTRPVQWKIPNDFAAVQTMQSTATPILSQDSPIGAVIWQMARAVCTVKSAAESETGRNPHPGGLRLPWRAAAKRPNSERVGPEAIRTKALASRSLSEVLPR